MQALNGATVRAAGPRSQSSAALSHSQGPGTAAAADEQQQGQKRRIQPTMLTAAPLDATEPRLLPEVTGSAANVNVMAAEGAAAAFPDAGPPAAQH